MSRQSNYKINKNNESEVISEEAVNVCDLWNFQVINDNVTTLPDSNATDSTMNLCYGKSATIEQEPEGNITYFYSNSGATSDLENQIREWGVKHDIHDDALSELLKMLQEFGVIGSELNVPSKSPNPLINQMNDTLRRICQTYGGINKKLDTIRYHQEMQKASLNSLDQKVQNNIYPQDDLQNDPYDISLPLNISNYNETLEQLELNPDFEAYMIKHLRCVGGKNLQDSTRRIINKLFTKEAQKEINYSGKNGKKKLSESAFYNLILKSLKHMNKDFNEEVASCVIKFHFQRGNERYNKSIKGNKTIIKNKTYKTLEFVQVQDYENNYDNLASDNEDNYEISLPLNIADYDETTAKLGLNAEFEAYLLKRLRCVGGKNLRDATRRIINKLFSKEAQKEINYTGKNGKKKLSESAFYNLILKSLKYMSKEYTEEMVSPVIKLHFQRGNERYKKSIKAN